MAIGHHERGLTRQYNSVYNITLDMSGWDKTTIQAIAPITGSLYVYGTNDPGAVQGVTDGNATLATNFLPIQVTNLGTGSATAAITAAGLYKADVNAQFLRLQGGVYGVQNVYRILMFHSKI